MEIREPRVYVAGSSKELHRADHAMMTLRGRGFRVTKDWVQEIRNHDGKANRGIPIDVCRRLASNARDAVNFADFLVLLLPSPGNESIGLWVEFGIWLGRPYGSYPNTRSIASGGFLGELAVPRDDDPEEIVSRSIFLSRCDHATRTDSDAFDWVEMQARNLGYDV